MNLVKIISSTISASRQAVKFLRYGKSDVQETPTVSPYGIDSNPVADMVGLYAETGEKGKNVLIGYINKSAIAQPGENRLFSTDTNGVVKAVIYLRNNGDLELNGDEDYMVRYSELKAGFDDLKAELNAMITNWNLLTTVYIPGGPTVVGSPLTLAGYDVPLAIASIDASKINNVRTSLP